MCGITGVIHLDGRKAEATAAARMAQRLEHRGPDGHGAFSERSVAFAHQRLSIIDLSGGAQPMESSTKRSVVAFNGEIYNMPVLRERLRGLGYGFRTHSDTEVILAAYEAWGTHAFSELRGMYAFALYDRAEQRVYLVRDPMGIKPLYVFEQAHTLHFASELKAIREAVGALSLDAEAVNAYFLRQYIGGPGTIFEGVRSLPPGSYQEIQLGSGQVRERRYYRLPAQRPESIGLEAAAAKLEDELHRSVKEHMLSDVPVGVFLSGGLDSSLLLAMASEVTDTPLNTFSVGFGDASVDEVEYARIVAEAHGAVHHELRVAATEGLSVLPQIVQNMDQPLADYAVVPTFVMSRFAADHVKVVLGGEGADEVFGGYWKRYLPNYLLAPFGGRVLPPTLYGPMLFRDPIRRKLLGGRFVPASTLLPEQRLRKDLREYAVGGSINAALHADIHSWLVDDLLMKVDTMSMLASLEARVPYLDRDLVETVSRWPGELKLGWRQTKRVMREVARRRLPEMVATRSKHGFTVPVGHWLRAELRGEFEARVFAAGPIDEWLQRPVVESLWKQHQQGRDYGLWLWSILIFAWWLDSHCRSPHVA